MVDQGAPLCAVRSEWRAERRRGMFVGGGARLVRLPDYDGNELEEPHFRGRCSSGCGAGAFHVSAVDM